MSRSSRGIATTKRDLNLIEARLQWARAIHEQMRREQGGKGGMVEERHLGEIGYEIGSGNVFADLAVPNPEGALLTAELARQINRHIAQRGLSHPEAATLLGLAESKVSDLNVGRLRDFSVERLRHFLTLLGNDVEIVVRPVAHAPGETRVAVCSACEEWTRLPAEPEAASL